MNRVLRLFVTCCLYSFNRETDILHVYASLRQAELSSLCVQSRCGSGAEHGATADCLDPVMVMVIHTVSDDISNTED